MILLDPDLDSEPDPRGPNSKRAPANRPATIDRNSRVPTTRTLTRFLTAAQAAVRLRGHVSVLLTTDRNIRRINRQFRGKDKATDVLSFPAEPRVQKQENVAGDLAVSVQTALRQAREQRHALTVELKVLMLHGLLHLAGYDHERDNGLMARREQVLRTREVAAGTDREKWRSHPVARKKATGWGTESFGEAGRQSGLRSG